MLDYRLNVLNDMVDYFILVEANQTYVGKPKKLYFEENKHLFEKFLHKIIHVVVDLPYPFETIHIQNGEQWINEKHQRNCIKIGLEKIQNMINDNDYLVIADIDEIPDPSTLLKIKENIISGDILVLEQDFYYYNLNSKKNEKWYHSKIINYKKYKELNIKCDDIRFSRGTIIKNGGWHLSYFGDSNFIKNKLENFSHQEYNSNTYTDIESITRKIADGKDLFNRENENMIYIKIKDNSYLPPLYKVYLSTFYESDKLTITIGFHSNQLGERGTEVALYDYAYYNEKLYNNKSIILYSKNSPNNNIEVIKKFEAKFTCYGYENLSDIENIIKQEKIDYFYAIKYGNKDNLLVKSCPNLVHAVFTVEPHGEKYATISKYLSNKHNNVVDYVPHMINLPIHNENMRDELKIPCNAIVLGRYGGFEQFDIEIVYKAIIKFVQENSNIYFIFANTKNFYEHPQIIYMDKIIDPYVKVKFINTCDVMIHARSDGETFGLSIGEFSSCNKPVITCKSLYDNCHIDILGDKAIIYDSFESLVNIFTNIQQIIKSRDDWNAYKEYTPENVMDKFYKVFLN